MFRSEAFKPVDVFASTARPLHRPEPDALSLCVPEARPEAAAKLNRDHDKEVSESPEASIPDHQNRNSRLSGVSSVPDTRLLYVEQGL